jgi:hypothetical protein
MSGSGGAGTPSPEEDEPPQEKPRKGGKPPQDPEGFRCVEPPHKPSPRKPYIDQYGRLNYHEYQGQKPVHASGLKANPWGFNPGEEFFWGIGAGSAQPPVGHPPPNTNAERHSPDRRRESSRRRRERAQGESRRIRDMTTMELTDLVTSIARNSSGPERYDYDYAPRRRYHLLELPKFSGKVEDYPLFRQNLGICLERERFRDEKDKALFIYNHLEGQAKDLVAHFMVPLSRESCQAVLSRLERTYGREQDIDRLLIRKLYKLPKLTDLTYDALVHMITVIEAAMPAMYRREPEELQTADGDRLSRLLGLLPPNDADLFYLHCQANGRRPDLPSLLGYLTFRCQARKVRLPLPTERPALAKMSKPKVKAFYQGADPEDHTDQESDEGNLVLLTGAPRKQRPPCSLCENANHDLGYCPKFKTLDINEKRAAVDKAKACSGCLRSGHFIRDCRSKKKCTHEGCTRSHHPLLHDDYQMRINYFDEVGGEFPGAARPESSDSQ